MNDSRTCTESGAKLTHNVPETFPVTGDLKRLRDKYGFDSAIGRRCSNILETMDGMPRPPEEWIDYLMPDWVPIKYAENCRSLARQTSDLNGLLRQSPR